MDPLSDVLSLLKPRSYTFGGTDEGGSLSFQFPRHQGIKCYAVVRGQRWLSVEGVPDPVHLTAGDCIILPRGLPFILATDLSVPPVDALSLHQVPRRNGEIVTINGGGDCLTVGGHFLLEGPGADFLLGLLPPLVHLSSESDKAAMRWSMDRLMQELREPQPGSVLIAQQLAYSMLVQALRLHLREGREGRVGWLFALADEQIRQALYAMHDEPARAWTLEELAKVAGMSRSSFAQRFKEIVGQPAMEYLLHWRMTQAADRLMSLREPVSEVAFSSGYQSESAFSAAFKRVKGKSPRRYTRDLIRSRIAGSHGVPLQASSRS